MKEILRAPYGSKRMFAVRALYWLTYPVYGHKNIWVTFDKLYKGGDCGEYFYKYMRRALIRPLIDSGVCLGIDATLRLTNSGRKRQRDN